MKYILYNNDKIPALGLGTYPMQGKQCYDIVRLALEMGYRHFDTAESYKNEESVGLAIYDSGIPRNQIFLTTKCGFLSATADNIHKEFSKSLNLLHTDYVDLLLYHWHHENTSMNESLGALEDIRKSGRTRRIGVGNFTIDLMREAIDVHDADLFTNQFESHPLLRQSKLEDETHNLGMIVTAHSPVARGRIVNNDLLKLIGDKYGKSPSQVAIRWQLDKPNTMLIPKSTRTAGLSENINVFDFSLDDEDRKLINSLPNNLRGSRPSFEPNWDSIT
jgi:2,5-diketo-D-gluconate reductase B